MLTDGRGNLAATAQAGLVHGYTKTIGDIVVDPDTWKDICTNPLFSNQGKLNEFLRRLIPAKVEQVISTH